MPVRISFGRTNNLPDINVPYNLISSFKIDGGSLLLDGDDVANRLISISANVDALGQSVGRNTTDISNLGVGLNTVQNGVNTNTNDITNLDTYVKAQLSSVDVQISNMNIQISNLQNDVNNVSNNSNSISMLQNDVAIIQSTCC